MKIGNIPKAFRSPLSADGLFECLKAIDKQTLQSFKNFIRRNGDSNWIIVSDYQLTSSKEFLNDVYVFTVFPGERNFATIDAVQKAVPCKLSTSKVRDDVIKGLKSLNCFTFAFLLEKHTRIVETDDLEGVIERSIALTEKWINADECTKIIDKIKELRKFGKEDVKAFNHAILASNLAAAITALIAQQVRVERVTWGSDRESFIEGWGRISDTIFSISTSAFFQQIGRKEPKTYIFAEDSNNLAGENEKLTENRSNMGNAKKSPLWFSPYVNIPDHFASPLAQVPTIENAIFHSDREKYQKILAYAVTDHSKVVVVKLNQRLQGWGLSTLRFWRSDFVRMPPLFPKENDDLVSNYRDGTILIAYSISLEPQPWIPLTKNTNLNNMKAKKKRKPW